MKTDEMEVINCDSLKEETTIDLNNDLQKVERIKSLELLKKKMCRSHDLIQYYNDKKKECEQLTISLRKARAEANEMKNNYNTTLSKLIKQELQNTEQRKTMESYVTKISELETKIAGDQRFIEQLNCKIDSIEDRSSGKLMDTELKFEEKVKTLELELKKFKKGPAKKNQGTNTDKIKIVEHGKLDPKVRLDPKVPQEPPKKNIPNTSRKITKNSTFLCEKCDVALNNLVQTFKVPEPMIQPFPPENKQYKFKSSESFAKLEDKKIESKVKSELPVALENNIENPVKQEESETFKILTKTLKTLERVIKTNKKSEKKAQCCHSNSGSQDLMLQMWKKLLDRDEPKKSRKKLKRCQNIRKSITKKKKKKKTKTKNTNWSIESTIINSEASTSQIDAFKIPQLIDHSKLVTRENSTIKRTNKRKKGNNSEILSSSGENESLMNSSKANESQEFSEKKEKNSEKLTPGIILPAGNSNLERIILKPLSTPISSAKEEETEELKLNQTNLTEIQILDEKLENSITTSTPRKNRTRTVKSSQKVERRINSPRFVENCEIGTKMENTPINKSEILISNLEETVQIQEIKEPNEIYLKNKVEEELHSNPKIGENDQETKMECENSEEVEISPKEEEDVEVKNNEEFPKIESFEDFQNTVEFQNSKNNQSSMESFKGFHNSHDGDLTAKNVENIKEFEILREFEIFEKDENCRKEEMGENFDEKVEKMTISAMTTKCLKESEESLEETKILAEEIKNFEKEFKKGKILKNLEKTAKYSEEEIENIERETNSTEGMKNSGSELKNEKLKQEENVLKLEEKMINLDKGEKKFQISSTNSEEKMETSSLELKNGEELQKMEKSNLEEEMENLKKDDVEEEEKVQILVKNSTNFEEKLANMEETENEKQKIQNSEEKSTNLNEGKTILDKELKNSAKSINCENEDKGKNPSNENEELLSVIDVLGEISFSDESILDCNASFLTLSTEKSQTNPEESQIDENEEETTKELTSKEESELNSEEELKLKETELNSKEELKLKETELNSKEELKLKETELNSKEELKLKESELEKNNSKAKSKLNESQLIEESESNQKELEKMDIFLSNSDVAKIPRNSIHGNRSTEMRLTLISPKRRGRKRKSADVANIVNHQKTTRTSLLTKMRTLKKRSSEMMTTATTTSSASIKKNVRKTEISIKSSNIIINEEENNFPPVMSKKRRIAHTPKIDDDDFDVQEKIPIIRKSLRSASKSPGAARNSLVTSQLIQQNLENSPRTRNKRERIAQKIKETKLLRNSTKIEETKKEGCEIPIVKKRGRPKKEKTLKTMEENSSNGNFPKPIEENIPNETSSKASQKTSLGTNSPNLENLPNAKLTDKSPTETKSPRKNTLEAKKSERTTKTNSPNKNRNAFPKIPNDEEMKIDGEKEVDKLQEQRKNFQNYDLESPLSPDAEIDEEISDESDAESESSNSMIVMDNFIEIDEVNESWKIANAALNNMQKNDSENLEEKFSNDSQVSSMEGKIQPTVKRDFKCLNLSFTNPMFEHMNRPFSLIPKKGQASQTSLEKRISLQINRLIDDKDWTSELHFQVVEEIWTFNDIKTTAKCILNVLTTKCTENRDEPMDSTHTPPAPMMTRTQQKIITLISALEEKCKQSESLSIFELIFDGINYSLFRLGFAPDRCVVEGLSRVFTCMARLKKDRERARLFIIDALYCYRFKAVAATFVVLTCWSEVFPNYDSNIEILPKCMAYIIYTIRGCYEALKKLLTNRDLYNYPLSEMFPDQLAAECLSALEKKHERSIDTAIILLSKSMGPKWTQKIIIQGESGLKQLIVGKRHKSPYDAFTLLGNVMRSFPEEDNDGHLSQIVEQLCDLLDSDEGSDDHLEGVASALLCFSKYRKFFCKVAKSLISWTPKRELRDETRNKFQFFSNSQPKHWWYDFIQSNYTKELPKIQQEVKKITQIGDKKQKVQPKMNNSNSNKIKKRTKNIRKKQAAAKIAMKNNSFTSQ